MKWQGQYYSGQMCQSEEELDDLFHFTERDPSGFSYYRAQILAPTIWPIAVLTRLEVPSELRSRGHGARAVQDFLTVARNKGAHLAFLKVAWFGGLVERDRLVSWYNARGWQLLENPPIPSFIVPFMYHEA